VRQPLLSRELGACRHAVPDRRLRELELLCLSALHSQTHNIIVTSFAPLLWYWMSCAARAVATPLCPSLDVCGHQRDELASSIYIKWGRWFLGAVLRTGKPPCDMHTAYALQDRIRTIRRIPPLSWLIHARPTADRRWSYPSMISHHVNTRFVRAGLFGCVIFCSLALAVSARGFLLGVETKADFD